MHCMYLTINTVTEPLAQSADFIVLYEPVRASTYMYTNCNCVTVGDIKYRNE